MNTERLLCDACGAPLEIPEAANFVTCQHCRTSLQIKSDRSVRHPQKLEPIDRKLNTMSKWQEVEAIDRKWEMDRKQHLSDDGTIPTIDDAKTIRFTAIFYGVLAASFCLVFSWLAPILGLLVFAAIWGEYLHKLKIAKSYQAAEASYVRERQQAIDANAVEPETTNVKQEITHGD